MQFKIPFVLPVAQQQVQYIELTNQQHFGVIKYMATGDDVVIERMLDQLVEELTGESASKMYAVDKFCLLVDVRSIALGDRVEFKTSTHAKASLALGNIIDRVRELVASLQIHHEIVVGDMILTTSIPRKWQTTSIDDLVHNCIYSIQDGDDVYLFDDMTTAQQHALVESLPAEVFNAILSTINHHQNTIGDAYIIKPNVDIGIEALPFNLYNNALFAFLKSIYADDLMGFYELQYSMISKLQLSYDHFMQMTPNECKVFINIHNKEIKKQEDNQKSHNKPAGRFPGT